MSQADKPKIVYILPEYNPDTASHFFHLYEIIQAAGERLDIFLVIEKFTDPFFYDRKKMSQSLLAAESQKIYCQRFSFPPFRFGELFFVLAKERMLGRRFFYTHYSFYGALASWLVTRILGGRAYYWNCGIPWFYRRFWLKEAVFRFILRHTILVTGTAGLAGQYTRQYNLNSDKIRLLPNWINIRRFQMSESANTYDRKYSRKSLGIPEEAKIVLFVHRLSRRKGTHLLPEIIRQVTDKDKNVIFLIAGGGPERGNLKLEIRNLKLEKYVRLIGEIPQREIQKYFRVADIFLMPSEEEGFPHVLLEAMASGVPYVASDVGGVKEITPPELQNFIVPSGNINMFAQKILEILAKPPQTLTKISSSEQEWVKKYDIKAVLPQFGKLFGF